MLSSARKECERPLALRAVDPAAIPQLDRDQVGREFLHQQIKLLELVPCVRLAPGRSRDSFRS